MKRLLPILFILLTALIPSAGRTWGVVGLSSGSGGGGDTCGTDDCTFIWYAEHATDVTSGTPAGCSSGDTSPALTRATISGSQYHDGSNSLLVDHVQEYAEFDSADIMDSAHGTIEMWVYLDTFLSGGQLFRWPGTEGSIYTSVLGTSDNIEFRFRYYYPYSNITVDTDGVDGVEDTWYKVVYKWTNSDVNPNIGIYVYNASEELLDSATSDTNPNAWGEPETTFDIGCFGYVSGEYVVYIDGVKIWSAWK